MRVLSLFDGIATGRLALEMAGVPVDLYIASEIDKDAKAVARANWPDMIHIGPVENVTAPDLPKIDLVIGGSPCQGFSRAGAGLNFDDPRSRLFFDYVRVLNEVREKNPDVKFLLENVIMKREWEDVITEKLGVQPVHINSRAHSAQNRPRAYWSNIADLSPLSSGGGQPLDTIIDRSVDVSDFTEAGGLLFGPGISEGSMGLVQKTAGGIVVKQATACRIYRGRRWRRRLPRLPRERHQTRPRDTSEKPYHYLRLRHLRILRQCHPALHRRGARKAPRAPCWLHSSRPGASEKAGHWKRMDGFGHHGDFQTPPAG